MDYEKKYNEALERFKAFKEKYYTKNTVIGDAIFDKTGEMQKDFESIFPELRESEDERIRKRIVLCLDECVHSDVIRDYERDECLAWLETQKESLHIPETCKENADSFTDSSEDEKIRKWMIKTIHLIGVDKDICADQETMDKAIAWLEKKKDQPTDAKTERVIKAARRVLNNWLDGTDCPDVSGDFAELEYAIREYDGEEKQKEQKPVEQKVSRAQIHHELLQNGTITMEEYLKLTENLYFPKEQKPAWSEEDEKELDCIINILDRLGFEEFCKSSRDQDNEEERFYYKEIQFLKRLKSLRPQPKPDCNGCSKHLEGYINGRSDAENKLLEKYGIVETPEDELHMKARWKPSEEQMKALKDSIEIIRLEKKDSLIATILESLYEQLKKLM